MHIFAWVLSGVSAASFAYVALSLVIVANLLWDAFEREEQDIIDENPPRFPSSQ
ncbi:hypothetical protein [Plantibacter sp. CFBP 8804]|uniref:hypothetical protein n=1 Tax=Plantibacter sp. CFBP 8804 TaxID=2775270 RepID=UPI001786C2FB|nr:hypothetical protein [Plantibacter sp. CFBP 8804]MBD8519116.1 hypothetical protein [Plantibacter sp. CFBP 8804]